MYILSQVLVVLADVIFIISMLGKQKKNIVFLLIISTVFLAFHYLCLNAWSGMAMALVELTFLIAMYILELSNKTKYNMHVSVIGIVSTIVLSILTWNSCISLLPMFAMVVYISTMIFPNIIIVKSGSIIRLILNAIYMFLIKSYFGAGFNVLIIIFTVIALIDDFKANKQLQINSQNSN